MIRPSAAFGDSARLASCVVGLGLVTAWVSLALRIGTRTDTVHNLSAVLNGQPLEYGNQIIATLPFYNRILFPAIHRAFVSALPFLTAGQWYILLRVATILLGLAAFTYACRRSLRAAVPDCCLAVAFLAVSMIATFSFGWEDPTDALDLCSLSLAILAALEARFVLCLAVAVFFASNRESAAYAGIIWFFVAPATSGSWRRRATQGAVICLASYGATIALRLLVSKTGTSKMVEIAYNIGAIAATFRPFIIINWLGVLTAVVAMLCLNIDRRLPLAQRLVALAAIFVIPAVIFGHVNELRVFLPCFVMLCFASALGIRRESL